MKHFVETKHQFARPTHFCLYAYTYRTCKLHVIHMKMKLNMLKLCIFT